MQLFEELIPEGENTVLQDQFQEFHNLIFFQANGTSRHTFQALGPELPVPVKEWKRYVDDVFSIIPKGNRDTLLQYLNSIDPHIKFTIEQPNARVAFPFWTPSLNLKEKT